MLFLLAMCCTSNIIKLGKALETIMNITHGD